MKKIETTKAPGAIGPYVQGNIVNGVLYASGQIPINPASGEVEAETIEKQTKQVMENIGGILTTINGDYTDIIKTTCYLSDMENFGIFNEVYGSYFDQTLPARSCVEVARLPKDVLVEVEIIAEVPK